MNLEQSHQIDELTREVERRRQAEEWLRVTLASIGDAVLATDVHGRVTFLNPVAETLIGWKRAEAEGQPLEAVFRIVNEYSRQPAENPVSRVLREGAIVGLANHTVLIARDGTERGIADSAAPIKDEHGAVTGVVLIFRDVTAERRAEETRRRLAAIVESSDDAIFAKTLDGIITSWNRAAERLYGYTAEEIVGQSVAVLVPPERAGELAAMMDRVRRRQPTDHFETLRRRKDGSTVEVSVSVSPIAGAEGQVIGASTIARDITHSRQAERELRESQEWLRLALETGRMGTWEWHLPTNTFRGSPGLEAIHGLAPGTSPGTLEAYEQLVHPDGRARVQDALRRTREEGTEHHIEYRIVWPDRSVHWIEGRCKLFCDAGDQPLRLIGVCVNIDERKRTEQTTHFLADASAALAAIVDYQSTLQKVAGLAVPFFADWCAVDMLDDRGALRRLAVAHVDPAKVELAHELQRRYPSNPSAAQGVWKVLRTGQSELIADISDDFLAARVKDAELRGILRSLGLRSYIGVPLSVRGKALGVLTFVTAEGGRRYDAADLAVAEDLAHRAAVAIENARLYQAARDADRHKDEFLALLGHELRNPLAPIRNALHALKLPGVDAAISQRAWEMMDRQVEHLVRLVDDLLDVSRVTRGKVELRREPVELATVAARAVETSHPVIEAGGHRLTIALPSEPLAVKGDLVRLAQVVSNLLTNAAKYTERGGQIWLTVCREGGDAVLRVRDTGIGIAPDLLPRLFDMFFQAERRTRESQGGLGIGLSLVRGIVELHGGTVAAHSAGPGQGSEFVVRLPLLALDEAKATRRTSTDPALADRPAPRRVLVVDDNMDAADSLAMLLRLEGQEVQIAYDGASALALAESEPPTIAFLDLGMPRMDGFQLAREFQRRPALQGVVLVALTGLGQPEDRQRTRGAGFDHHLVKPVELSALNRLLGEHD